MIQKPLYESHDLCNRLVNLQKRTDMVEGNSPKNMGDSNEQEGGGQRRVRAEEECVRQDSPRDTLTPAYKYKH